MLTKAEMYLLKELHAINSMHAVEFLGNILREKKIITVRDSV